MTDHLKELTEAGVSIWLDDLSRERIETGNLPISSTRTTSSGSPRTRRSSPPRWPRASATTSRCASSRPRAPTSTRPCSR